MSEKTSVETFISDYLQKESQIKKRLKLLSQKCNEFVKCDLDAWEKSNPGENPHFRSLLFGQVQSGKTEALLMIAATLSDKRNEYTNYFYLTSDNKMLQEQTFQRTVEVMSTSFRVLNETDQQTFKSLPPGSKKIVILKKNYQVLNDWIRLLNSVEDTKFTPIVILDDEADQASLNTKINKADVSKIHSQLDELGKCGNGSISFQATATPQALLMLQDELGWKPQSVHILEPGPGYTGGDFFFNQSGSYATTIIDDLSSDSLNDAEEDPTIPEDLAFKFLSKFAIVSAHRASLGLNSNGLVHPSVLMDVHVKAHDSLKIIWNRIVEMAKSNNLVDDQNFILAWQNLQLSKPDLIGLDIASKWVSSNVLKFVVINSASPDKWKDLVEGLIDSAESSACVFIGGNALGRGVTIPGLHITLYNRTAKVTMQDTLWQHCRMFGYDRDPSLCRVFLSSKQNNLFLLTWAAINSIQTNPNILEAALFQPDGTKVTRSAIIDKNLVVDLFGGVNYFSFKPPQKEWQTSILDDFNFSDNKVAGKISKIESVEIIDRFLTRLPSTSDFYSKLKNFKSVILSNRVGEEDSVAIFYRRGRKITGDKGIVRSLLSPNDRVTLELCDSPAIMIYEILGTVEQGWDGNPFLIPNIRLPLSYNVVSLDG